MVLLIGELGHQRAKFCCLLQASHSSAVSTLLFRRFGLWGAFLHTSAGGKLAMSSAFPFLAKLLSQGDCLVPTHTLLVFSNILCQYHMMFQ